MNRRTTLVALVGAALGADPLRAYARSKSAYKIGVTYPLTGPLVPLAVPAQQAMKLAIDDINKGGGVDGHPLELDVADTQGTPAGGIAAMRKVVQVDGCQAILTVFTNVVTAQMPLGDQLHVPTISPVESPGLVSKSTYSFAHSQTIGEEGPLLTAFWKRRGYKRIYAMLGDNAWGHVIEPIVKEAVEKVGAQYGVAFFALDQSDFRGVATRAKEFAAEALLITAQGSTAETSVISQVRQLGVDVPIFNPGNYYNIPTWRAGVGSYVNGMYFAGLNLDVSNSPRFVLEYRARYGHDPSYVAGEAYDQVQMLAYAIRRGGYSGSAIRDQLAELNGVPSVFGGDIVMQPDHYTKTTALAIWQARDGKLAQAFTLAGSVA
jgi:branched-chain amino acid transport system substrate-binding protein